MVPSPVRLVCGDDGAATALPSVLPAAVGAAVGAEGVDAASAGLGSPSARLAAEAAAGWSAMVDCGSSIRVLCRGVGAE